MAKTENIIKLLENYPLDGNAIRIYQTKANGKKRPIAKPNDELNKWLKQMHKALRQRFNSWPTFMHGGIKRRSYVSYARPHTNQQCVITIDIKECFDSITVKEVAVAIEHHLKLSSDTSLQLAQRLCFHGKLAQGFATSNYLSNLYLLTPLTILNKELRSRNIVFTNYVDDLALSGVLARTDEIINLVAISLSRARLTVNKAKIEVMPSSRPQLICGLIVNKKLSLTRLFKLKLLGNLASGVTSSISAEGWISNLKTVDDKFRKQYYLFALKKGVIKIKTEERQKTESQVL